MQTVYPLHSPALDTAAKVKDAGMNSQDRRGSMRGSHCSRVPQRNRPKEILEEDDQVHKKFIIYQG